MPKSIRTDPRFAALRHSVAWTNPISTPLQGLFPCARSQPEITFAEFEHLKNFERTDVLVDLLLAGLLQGPRSSVTRLGRQVGSIPHTNAFVSLRENYLAGVTPATPRLEPPALEALRAIPDTVPVLATPTLLKPAERDLEDSVVSEASWLGPAFQPIVLAGEAKMTGWKACPTGRGVAA